MVPGSGGRDEQMERGMFEGMEPVEFEHEGTRLRGYAAGA